jgi:hypothetical protein
MLKKRVTITSKDINLDDLSWLCIFISQLGSRLAGWGYEDLRIIDECLNKLQIYPNSITSITLLITGEDDIIHIKIDKLVY